MNLTIAFEDVSDLRIQLHKLNSSLQTDNLEMNNQEAIRSLSLSQLRMTRRLRNGLSAANITTLGAVESLTATQFIDLEDLGDVSLREANDILQGFGLAPLR